MRLEVKDGINDSVLINDAYNLDLNSLALALDYLHSVALSRRRTLVLSDIAQSGLTDDDLYGRVAGMVARAGIDFLIGIGPRLKRYAALFEHFWRSGQENAMDAANEAGRRGLTYLARAQAFDKLGDFASKLVTGTSDPALLRGVIAELQAVAEQLPAGEDRWSLRVNLADALDNAGRSDDALPFYAQAAAEAEDAGHWADVGWICGNWASALGDVGELDAAKATYRRCVDALKRADDHKIKVIGMELEALRIHVKQG